ncbi:MAG: HAMP domain-containing histidine kinase [Peptococcaceae bacterium]|jgi:signal transduction histidine kinase|nr:HAMP domain-containing histidine kinase [Peptococcaceae bacterium]
MTGPKRHGPHHPLVWRGFGCLLMVVIYTIALSAGYGVTFLLFRWTGRLPLFLSHILTGLVGILLLVVSVGVFMKLSKHYRTEHSDGLSQLTGALKQISQGNFDVLLTPSDNNHTHGELVNIINDMAKNLGTLENMRQDFISNVSHEIQSPLTSIGGFAALLKTADLSASGRLRYAEIIEAESRRLSSLSENLLKLSSLDHNKLALNKKEFRLDKQLETVLLTLESQWAAKKITPEADLPKCAFYGDEDLLSQVWINLLHNAIKFTPPGGQISVTLAIRGEQAVAAITDNGVGIAPEEQLHIFERFFKADKSRDRALGGNGLGLSLVKSIVELHNGRVSVDSTPEQGSVFSVFLPLTK